MLKKKFKYSITILNLTILILELFILVYSFFRWNDLTKGDGYGLVAIALLSILISTGLILDFILQYFLKNKNIVIIIEIVLSIIYISLIYIFS